MQGKWVDSHIKFVFPLAEKEKKSVRPRELTPFDGMEVTLSAANQHYCMDLSPLATLTQMLNQTEQWMEFVV